MPDPNADPYLSGIDPLAALIAGGYAPDPSQSAMPAPPGMVLPTLSGPATPPVAIVPTTAQSLQHEPLAGAADQGPSGHLADPFDKIADPFAPPPSAQAKLAQITDQSAAAARGAPGLEKTPAYGDTTGAEKQENAAFNEESAVGQNKADADVEASREYQNQIAEAYKQHAEGLTDAARNEAQAREYLHRSAAAETATWMQKMDAQAAKTPDHHHWWDHTSGFSKAMWLASLAFGAGAVRYGGKNVGLDMLHQSIEEDMEQQKDRLARERENLKLRGTQMQQRQAQNLSDLQDNYSKHVMRLETLKQAFLEKAKAPGPAAAKQAHLAAAQEMDKKKLEIAGKRVAQSVTEKEGALNRSSENYRAQLSSNTQKVIASANIKKDYDLAELSADVSLAKDAKKGQGDTRAVSPNTGMQLVDPKTGSPVGDGMVRVHKDDKSLENMAGIATAGNQRYADLALIKKHVDDDSLWDLSTQKDPELTAAVVRLGYTTAKADDPGGRINDNDFTYGVKQSIGYDPTSGIIQPLQTSRNKAAMTRMIDKEMKDMVPRVQNEVNKYNDADLNGKDAKIMWSPRTVTAPAVPDRNATEQLRAAGVPVTLQEPKTVKDYNKAKELEDRDSHFQGQVLPPYDRAKVSSVAASFEGSSPEHIEAIAREALKTLEGNKDPWAGPVAKDTSETRVTKLAIESERDKALEHSRKAIKDAEDWLREHNTSPEARDDVMVAIDEMGQVPGSPFSGRHPGLSPKDAQDIVEKKFGLMNLRPQEWEEVLRAGHVLPQKKKD